MSVEQLLLVVFLVVLPLVQWLIGAMRARSGGPSGDRDAVPTRRTVSRPPPRAPDAGGAGPQKRPTEVRVPAAPPRAAVPHAVRHAPEPHSAPQRESRVRRDRQHRPPANPRHGDPERPTRAATPMRGGIGGGDLRRAIMMIAVLGPCRAVEPWDASQRG
jgi:hypothetical protein